jgi:hypothetical protein
MIALAREIWFAVREAETRVGIETTWLVVFIFLPVPEPIRHSRGAGCFNICLDRCLSFARKTVIEGRGVNSPNRMLFSNSLFLCCAPEETRKELAGSPRY